MSLFDGVVCDMEFDYRSEVFAGGMSGGAVGLYVLETEGTALRVWYIYDARAPRVERELLLEMTMSDSSSITAPRIDVSRTTDLVGIHWRDQSGCRYRQSTDGGVNWSTTYTVGSNFADTSHDDAALGFAIHGATRLACGNDGSGNYSVYRSTNGSTWAKLTDAVDSDTPIPQIAVRDGNVAYYTAPGASGSTPAAPDFEVTFDGGGYTGYTLNGSAPSGGDSTTDTFAGNPGNAAGHGGTSTTTASSFFIFPANPQHIRVTVDMVTPQTVYYVRFDHYYIFNTFYTDFQNALQIRQSVILYESDGTTVVHSASNIFETVASGTPSYANANQWFTVEFDFDNGGNGYPDVRYVVVEHTLGTTAGTNVSWQTGQTHSMRIDNIDIMTDPPTPIGGGGLNRVDGYNSSPTHTDITPTGDFIPSRPYGVAVNRASKNRIIILGDDGSDLKRFTSNNQGDSQTDQGATDFRGAVASSPVQILFGDNALSMSTDNGVTFADKRGNLADVFSSMAEIRKVKALI